MMKKTALVFLALFLVVGTFPIIGLADQSSDLGNYSWDGEWDTDWGEMVITQNGNQVTGTYTYDNGKINGTISGNQLIGIWSESPSYSAPNDAGEVVLEMAADGKSFSGKLRYGNSGDWNMTWKGTRVGSAVSAPITTPTTPTSGDSAPSQPATSDLGDLKTEGLSLLYRSYSQLHPITVKWNPTKQTIAVSYDYVGDYFEFSNSADASGTVLYKYNESSKNFEPVSNIVCKVAEKASPRSGNENYGEAVLGFEQSGSAYNFSAGRYAMSIYIVGNGYSHSSPSDELFAFEVGAATTPMTPTTPPTTTTPPSTSGNNSAESFPSGAKLSWEKSSDVLGYRLYRSETSDQLGISVTDFYITSTSFADVNGEPNTTYHYTVKPVLAEARPFEDIEEKLGDTIATYTVTTGSEAYKSGQFKHFVLLKLDDPMMSVDGVEEEVDPGRGTTPIIVSNRTMVPIRAVVEAMGGTVGWDGSSQKISLTTKDNQVELFVNQKTIIVNGVSKSIDVAPIIYNSRTFVPVRFSAENLGCKVDWINSTKEIVIVYTD